VVEHHTETVAEDAAIGAATCHAALDIPEEFGGNRMTPVRDDVVARLSASSLVEGLSAGEVAAIAGELEEQQYLAGNRVITEGMHGVEFFLIVEGAAAIESGGVNVASLGPGDFFGEVGALDQGPRTATVRATSRLRCLTLPHGTLMTFLLDHPHLAVNMLHTSVQRFRAAMTSGRLTGSAGTATP
jgi:CRP-like cAMP-binding protein